MKNYFFILITLFAFASCTTKKDLIEGKWKYNTTTTKDAGNSSVVVNSSGKIDFNDDGTYTSEKDGTMIVLNKQININNVETKGTWKLSEDEQYITMEAKESNNKERMLEGFRNAGFPDSIINLMGDFSDKFSKDGGDITTDKIIQLDKSVFIVEIQGNIVDGEKITYYKIE